MSRRQPFSKPISFAAALSVAASFAIDSGTPATAAPSVKYALTELKPIQPDVAYDRAADVSIDECKLRDIDRDDWAGWEVVSPTGEILRRFADTNGDSKVDLWCYFHYGVEVYRDIDADFNGKADQYRWLGTAGIRWGLDEDEDMTIDRWKQISAVEVSAELVAAIRDAQPARFIALLASERDLRDAGLGKAKARELAEKAVTAAKQFGRLVKSQDTIDKDARWLQFAAGAPGVVPQGTDGATEDVVVYENAVAMFDANGSSEQLMIGTMIRVGDTWKLIDLPSITESGQPIEQISGHFFRPAGDSTVTSARAAIGGQEMQQLVSALEKVDNQLSTETDKRKIAQLQARRADVVEQLIDATTEPNEKDMWIRQLVETVSFAVQSDSYPDGLERLKEIRSKYGRGDRSTAAYIEYQIIGTEYARRLQDAKNSAKALEWYTQQLAEFVEDYPQAPESAPAMLQLAFGKEIEDDEKKALRFYKQVLAKFDGTQAAEKAEGAIRRLDGIGKPVSLTGTTLAGKSFDLRSLKGRPVVIQYWAEWCDPCKEDAKQLRRLKAQYRKAGLEIVGISVDATRQDALAFAKANQMPWVLLFEDGGLENSPLAQQFGVQTLPTMMLVDSKGRLVRHKVTVGELGAELKDLVK